jgi:hypothetical protein
VIAANLAIRFLLELTGLASLAVAGYQLPGDSPLRWVAAVGLPILLAAVWGVVVAPNTQNGIASVHKELIGTALLVVAAGALALVGHPVAGIGLAILVVANQALMLAIGGTDARHRLAGGAR